MKTDSSGGGVGNEVLPIMTDWFTSTLADSCSWGLFIIDDSLQFNVSDGSNWDRAKFDISQLLQSSVDFQMYTITFNNGVVKYYWGSGLEGTKSLSVSNIHDSNTTFKIGDWRKQDLPSYLTFYGSLDEILIYDRELNVNEISIIEGYYTGLIQSIGENQNSLFNVVYNSSSKEILVKSNELIDKIKIFSIDGKLISEDVVNSTEGKIGLNDFLIGVYLVEAQIGSRQFVKKVAIYN
jgi:hypothetical protein